MLELPACKNFLKWLRSTDYSIKTSEISYLHNQHLLIFARFNQINTTLVPSSHFSFLSSLFPLSSVCVLLLLPSISSVSPSTLSFPLEGMVGLESTTPRSVDRGLYHLSFQGNLTGRAQFYCNIEAVETKETATIYDIPLRFCTYECMM